MAQPTISIGSTGPAVTYLQQSLTKLGYNPGPIDGIFGSKTETAVNLFQKYNDLVVDGIVGNSTWLTIEKALASLFTISDYFPVKANTKYMYQSKGNDYSTYSIFVDYLIGSRTQLRYVDSGMDLVRVIENKDGNLTMLLSKKSDYRENFTSSPSVNAEILLKEPLVKGTTWTLADSRKRYISNVAAEVMTPLGKYIALEVTTEYKNSKNLDYYALNVGLVKTVFISNGNEISSTLSKIQNNVLFTNSLNFYYPNINDSKLYFVSKQLIFKTNDITRTKNETAYKSLPKGNVSKVLSPNAKIKSLYLNKAGMVYVDFSKELVNEMNAGSGYESMILQCITNTLGIYYGVTKVNLTVEDKPYSSAHIIMKKGQAFIVNLKDCIELK